MGGNEWSRSLRQTNCLWLLGAALLFAACGAPAASSSASHASLTVNVSATQTAYAEQHGPVTVAVRLFKQEGTLAHRDLNVIVQVIVTNHTAQPVWLFGTCQQPAMLISLTSVGSPANQTRTFLSAASCPLQSVDVNHNDGPGIVPSGSVTSMLGTGNVFDRWPDWPAGAYMLAVTIQRWHQGTLSQADQPGLLSGSALGQTVITLK